MSALHLCVLDSLVCHKYALVSRFLPPKKQIYVALTIRAVGVLQTEAGFVTLSHLGAVESQQIVVGEDLNAVVVPEDRRKEAI